MLREGNGNLRLVNPGNNIKSKVRFKILFFSCLDQPSVKLQIISTIPFIVYQRIFTYQNKKYIKVQRIHCTHSWFDIDENQR